MIRSPSKLAGPHRTTTGTRTMDLDKIIAGLFTTPVSRGLADICTTEKTLGLTLYAPIVIRVQSLNAFSVRKVMRIKDMITQHGFRSVSAIRNVWQ